MGEKTLAKGILLGVIVGFIATMIYFVSISIESTHYFTLPNWTLYTIPLFFFIVLIVTAILAVENKIKIKIQLSTLWMFVAGLFAGAISLFITISRIYSPNPCLLVPPPLPFAAAPIPPIIFVVGISLLAIILKKKGKNITYSDIFIYIAVVFSIWGTAMETGAFVPSVFCPAAIIPASGFEVALRPMLYHGTFNLTIGQYTGSGWTSANVFLVSAGSQQPSMGTFGTNMSSCVDYLPNGIAAGKSYNISLSSYVTIENSTLPQSCGPKFSTVKGIPPGALWVQYTTKSESGFFYVQIATIG